MFILERRMQCHTQLMADFQGPLGGVGCVEALVPRPPTALSGDTPYGPHCSKPCLPFSFVVKYT